MRLAAILDLLRIALEHVYVTIEVFMQRFWLRHLPDLDGIGGPGKGLVCVITGPTSGIGREAAGALARRGATVVLACRSLSRGEALRAELAAAARAAGQPHPQLEVMELDVACLASVRRFAAAWAERPDTSLHVLVNNAGVFAMGAPRAETADGLEVHMGTNYLGPFLLTLLLLPYLQRTAKEAGRPARVVLVSSKLHAMGRFRPDNPQLARGYSSTAAYAASKLAQVSFAGELTRRARGSVHAVALHPGEVMTDVVRALPGPMQAAYRLLLRSVLLTPPQGARCTVHCATSPDLESPKAAGAFYYDSCCAPTRPSREAQDPTLAAWLWDWSARMVGLKKAEDLPRSA